jgi:hypothetical protein
MRDYAARQGTSPTCQPPTGSLSPPRASRDGAQMGAAQEAPRLCANRAQHERGAHGHAGPPFYAPPPFTHERGLRQKPPFAPFAGHGKVHAPSLGPRSHTNGEVCPPFLPRKCLHPAPFVCERSLRRSHAGAWPSRLGTNRRCTGSPRPVCGAQEGRCPLDEQHTGIILTSEVCVSVRA